MAASEKLKFCWACGNKCRFTDRISGTCGENVSAKTSINDKPVMINVGIIRAAEYNELSLVKGSKLPVLVRKGFDADQVLKSAVKKHADCDQHFSDIETIWDTTNLLFKTTRRNWEDHTQRWTCIYAK